MFGSGDCVGLGLALVQELVLGKGPVLGQGLGWVRDWCWVGSWTGVELGLGWVRDRDWCCVRSQCWVGNLIGSGGLEMGWVVTSEGK